MLVCEPPRKHSTTQKQKKDKKPEKVIDLEAEEGEGTKDINDEGIAPITKFPNYIPPCKGNAKVTKDPDSNKFVISTPLLLEEVPFEGLHLARIPLLKMEDLDLANHDRFPHLVTANYVKHIYYVDSGVIVLEMVEWIRRVENSGLLKLLWVPHYHGTTINTTYVCQLLTLVHDGCLWLGGPIPITGMLIHRITHLSYKGLNLAKEFCKMIGEKDLAERMKKEFVLVKKL